ncbi:MAG: hypothetical protein IPJ88_11325 [Myxococcales bacterium]|nr:MAG: hypothetical protein IPJ88_11325 [Myxococcales bacterium]
MRVKIILGNLVAVLLLGLGSYVFVRHELGKRILGELDGSITNSQALFERSWRLSSTEFVNSVRSRAESQQVLSVFTALDETGRRTRAYEASEGLMRWFEDPARGMGTAPDIVVITDETGKVMARNGDRNRMYGESLDRQFNALRDVLQDGQARVDIWPIEKEGKLLRTAVAPVVERETGGTIGTVVVGYDLSDGFAQREASLLGREVAFLVDGRGVYSSSLPGNGVGDLKAFLFGPAKDKTAAALSGQGTSFDHWVASLGGDEFIGVTAPLPLVKSVPMAFAVMGNRSKALGKLDATNIILLLTILCIFVVFGYGFAIGTQILRPIEAIEEGVLGVINGNTDLRLDIDSAELGGLAFRINQLLNVFTGVSEADDGPGGSGALSRPPEPMAWKGDAFAASAQAAGAAPLGSSSDGSVDDANIAQKLASEDEGAYYGRIHQEYVAAKKAVGEDVSNIPKERFVERLKANEASLAKKHSCRMVRFQVQNANGQVTLQPVLIR